jgi:hypothetical protein
MKTSFGRLVVRAVRKQLQTIALLSLAHFDYERAGVSQFVSQFVSHFRLHPFALAVKPSGRPRYIGESDPRSNPVELSVNTRWLDKGAMGKPQQGAKASITENDSRRIYNPSRPQPKSTIFLAVMIASISSSAQSSDIRVKTRDSSRNAPKARSDNVSLMALSRLLAARMAQESQRMVYPVLVSAD